jgi:hypothetical protein
MTAHVVRPRTHIEAVRADSIQAAGRVAARTGAQPGSLVTDAISWALGQHSESPFAGQRAPSGASPADIDGELRECRSFLEQTPWSAETADRIDQAQVVIDLLEWLTGTSDVPPTYCRETEPGDLVGGRGRIVRADADIRRILALAQANIMSGQTSYALGTDWHQGIIATLRWVLGDRALTPIRRHVSPGQPVGSQITIEQGEAEDYLSRQPGQTSAITTRTPSRALAAGSWAAPPGLRLKTATRSMRLRPARTWYMPAMIRLSRQLRWRGARTPA